MADGRSAPLADAVRDATLTGGGQAIEYGELDKRYQQSTFAAHFVEVGGGRGTPARVRVRRMLAVCEAGRILNPQVRRAAR